MKRREPAAQAGGYLFNGITYPSEAEYLAAREKWQQRRQRLLAAVTAPQGGSDA